MILADKDPTTTPSTMRAAKSCGAITNVLRHVTGGNIMMELSWASHKRCHRTLSFERYTYRGEREDLLYLYHKPTTKTMVFGLDDVTSQISTTKRANCFFPRVICRGDV